MGPTEITRVKARTLTMALLLTIYTIPLVQHTPIGKILGVKSGDRPVSESDRNPIEMITSSAQPGSQQTSWFKRLILANRRMLRAMNTFEDRLEEESWFRETILCPIQYVHTRWLGVGNEQVYCGREGWLFYKPNVNLVTGPGFLDPFHLRRRAESGEEWEQASQPNPLKAILQFKKQLEQRGIALIIVPTPVKPMIHPEKLFRNYGDRKKSLRNPSSNYLFRQLRKEGVLVFDPAPLLANAKIEAESPLYLKTDTHWTPDAMTRTAQQLARFIREHIDLPPVPSAAYRLETEEVRRHGDLATMLKLTDTAELFPEEPVTIRQVLNRRGEMWQPSSSADILILGDSFSNVYSLELMGWGFSAGFIEHLGYYLQRPLDYMVRNDDGAFATRAMLSRELGRGKNRLAGKCAVVWQFAARELAFGNWKLLDMKAGHSRPRRFFVPPKGAETVITGVIEAISIVPKPGRVPYKDFIMALHVGNLRQVGREPEHNEAVVYTWGMRNNKWTSTAYARPGQVIRMRLSAWSTMADDYTRINRGELEDEKLLWAPPCWGETLDE